MKEGSMKNVLDTLMEEALLNDYAGATMTTTTTPDTPREEKVNPDNPDRKAIWTDCPHCARKHLLAAYAWLTQDTGGPLSVCPHGLLMARAKILLDEAITGGYVGNAALASGCIAAAESLSHKYCSQEVSQQFRAIRLHIDAMNLGVASAGLARILPEDQADRHAAAHLAEARRELPELGDSALGEDPGLGRFDGGYFHPSRSALCCWLIKTVRQLEETYELGAGFAPLKGDEHGKQVRQHSHHRMRPGACVIGDSLYRSDRGKAAPSARDVRAQ